MKKTLRIAVRERCAAALDRTHAIGERGPRTLRARQQVARWLDLDGSTRGLLTQLAYLERVAAEHEEG